MAVENRTTSRWRLFLWICLSVALWTLLGLVTWTLSYSIGGDRYDEQAAFFMKGLIGLSAVASTWKALQNV